MDELTIADFVGKASVADLQRLLNCLDSGEAGSGPDVEVLAALRKDDGMPWSCSWAPQKRRENVSCFIRWGDCGRRKNL